MTLRIVFTAILVASGILFLAFNQPMYESNQHKRLEDLCKVWGYLKYHHPLVSSGKIDWDSTLIAIIPKAIDAKSEADFNLLLTDMVSSVPEFTCRNTSIPDTLIFRNRINWIEDDRIRRLGLTRKLKSYSGYCLDRSNIYVEDAIPVKFKESAIQTGESVTIEESILSLFRYWNAINYFYPYLDLIDQNWDETLKQFIPVFLQVKTSEDLLQAVRALNARLDDGHARVQGRRRIDMSSYTQPPFRLITVEDKIFIQKFINDTFLAQYDIKIGDQLLGFNNRKIADVRDSVEYYFRESRRVTTDELVNGMLLMSKQDSISLEIKRDSKVIDIMIPTVKLFEMGRLADKSRSASGWRLLDSRIGYICPARLDTAQIDSVMTVSSDIEYLIVDLRVYPSGGELNYFTHFYTDLKDDLFALIKRPHPIMPGSFYFEPKFARALENKNRYLGKLILLVDSNTGSQLEYTAMKLQTIPGTVTIGQPTAGVDGNLSYITLPGMLRAFHSGIGVYYPDSSVTQRKGIRLDAEVDRTLQQLLSEDDEILQRAIDFAKE